LALALAAAAGPARAEPALSALPFWPAAPMVIATTLGAGVIGKRGAATRLSWGPSALVEAGVAAREQNSVKLPRVRLLATEGQMSLLRAPPALSARPWSERLPAPPGLAIENGPRSLVLSPDVRVTRSGAFLCLRGTF